jgi:arylsulfatase A-like enzyme
MVKQRLDRREFLKAAGKAGGAAALASLLVGCRPGGAPAGKQPNILFIMSDDHTSQAIGCYGLRLSEYAPTKNIDRLRAEGALVQNCFCTNSICVPSRASILTGQYSHVHGAKTLAGHLGPEADNAAKHLRERGYETAVFGKWHLKERPAGFDHYNVLRGQGRYWNPILFETGADWKEGGKEHPGHSTDVIAELVLDWLKKRGDAEKPFFLMCHFKAVHEPFVAHTRYNSLLADEIIPEPEDLLWPESPKGKRFDGWPLEILADRFLDNPARYAPPPFAAESKSIHDDPAALRRATYQKFIKDYLRGVAGIDDNVGRILDYLDSSGLRDDTVVFYTSDQGYFLGEHNLFDKRFMLEESLRMPLIIRHPGEIPKGITVKDIVLNIDFAPLFLDYAGASAPDSMQGRSFRPMLRGRPISRWRETMYYHYWPHQPERPSHYGVRTGRFKLIYYYGLTRMGRKPEDCWELYDLRTDPRELVNRYDDPRFSDVIPGLKRRLADLRRTYGDTADPLGK